jgi:hypothetical protein
MPLLADVEESREDLAICAAPGVPDADGIASLEDGALQ